MQDRVCTLTPGVTKEPLAFADRNRVVEPSAELHDGDSVTGWSLVVTGYLCITGKCQKVSIRAPDPLKMRR